jgi:hypothetical protein
MGIIGHLNISSVWLEHQAKELLASAQVTQQAAGG